MYLIHKIIYVLLFNFNFFFYIFFGIHVIGIKFLVFLMENVKPFQRETSHLKNFLSFFLLEL